MLYPVTPDGRYFVHNGRLWRCTNPELSDSVRQHLVNELMQARRSVRASQRCNDTISLKEARSAVHKSKVSLGERGPTWWSDDTDFNRYLVKNTPYWDWFTQKGTTKDETA